MSETYVAEGGSATTALEVGNIVVLKSGGPQMTVTTVHGDGEVSVVWQHEHSFETAYGKFPIPCVRKV